TTADEHRQGLDPRRRRCRLQLEKADQGQDDHPRSTKCSEKKPTGIRKMQELHLAQLLSVNVGQPREITWRGKPVQYKAGDTFYEPSGSVHRLARNPSGKTRTRLLAVILHSRDTKETTVPEKGKEP